MKRIDPSSFRYYPMFQKLVIKTLETGEYITSYKNVQVYPSSKDSISSFEASLLSSEQAVISHKAIGRFPRFNYDNGDRFLYFQDSQLRSDDILNIKHFRDKDNRKEFTEFFCESGIFSAESPKGKIQYNLIFKSKLSSINITDKVTPLELSKLGDIDVFSKFTYLIKEPTDPISLISKVENLEVKPIGQNQTAIRLTKVKVGDWYIHSGTSDKEALEITRI